MIYLLIILLISLSGNAVRLSIPLSSRGSLISSGYSGINITRFDWIGDYIGIKDDIGYTLWNYKEWNSEIEFTRDRSISNLRKSENFVSFREIEPCISCDEKQIDLVWSHDYRFFAQGFTFSDDDQNVIYIRNGSNLFNNELLKLNFNNGIIRSMNWGKLNGTNVLFIGTSNGKIWIWDSTEFSTTKENSSSTYQEYWSVDDGSIQYIDFNNVESSTIVGVRLNEDGNEIDVLNSSTIRIHNIQEPSSISQGKWNYDFQFRYYYSTIGLSKVYSITYNGDHLDHEIYYALDHPVFNSKSFRFSFSEKFDLFGILVDNKIQVYNTTTGDPISENLIFEYQEDGVPRDNFAIHPLSPLIVFNRGLPNPTSNTYESEIVIANIINNNFEYIIIPSIFITEHRYPSFEIIYGIGFGIITFVFIMNEMNIRSKFRKKQKFSMKKKILAKRAESLYPEK